jgi:hypothetical protein
VENCPSLAFFVTDYLKAHPDDTYWVAGGGTIYTQLLDRCDYLYLTVVKRQVEGDTFFPSAEHVHRTHVLDQVIHDEPQFRVERWANKTLPETRRLAPESWPIPERPNVNAKSARAKLPPLWFVAVLAYMVAFQIVRLYQTSTLNWLLCDYAQRLGALLLLALIPAAREVAFQTQKLLVTPGEAILWIIGLVTLNRLLGPVLVEFVNTAVPHTALSHYPASQGWLKTFDLTAGITLVAFHEEIVFRRCARAVFSFGWGDGPTMIVLSSLLFAAYHWWSGFGNIVDNLVFGLYAMLMLQRIGALWPLVVSHFICDLIAFS